MTRVTRFLLLIAAVLAGCWVLAGRAEEPARESQPSAIRLRRPVALVLTDAGKRLLVANRDSGTVTTLDTAKGQVLGEMRVGRRLSDMVAVPGRDLLLVTDEAAGELIVLRHNEGSLREVRRLKVGVSPVSVCVSGDGRLAAVAGLWPRQLLVFDLARVEQVELDPFNFLHRLPFAPRRLLPVPGGHRVLVADAFSGNLAVVNLDRPELEAVRSLPAHSIRGLALDRQGKAVLLAHQTLNAQGRTTTGDITTGNLLTNHVRKLPLRAVLDPSADVMRDARLYSLGDVERGAGDPADLVETDDGRLVVALAGVNEVAVGRPEQVLWTRLPVGRRPTALALDVAAKKVYVANTLSDSISVVELQERPRVSSEISLGATAELRPEERGELLFYDARLSHDAWFSCHSCHPDGHSNGRLNDNFTDGSFGTPKRVLSLLGVKDTAPYAWNGQVAGLETQVRTSIKSTMQGEAPSAEQVRDLAAFLRTLPPPPSLLKARGDIDPEAFARGRKVFARQKCATCHTPPTYTSAKTYDVGLRDEAGTTQFNPPSLRGISQAGPYFHDGRAATLEEVFTRYHHQLSGQLSEQEVHDLVTFLSAE